MDAITNFAYSTVATAPSPATTGVSLVLASGEGALFPQPSIDGEFNIIVWPTGENPLSTNAEICRVTARTTDTITFTREQEGTTARTIVIGDQVQLAPTKKVFTDIETLKANLASPIFTTQITTPIVYGSSASAGNLQLYTTSHATKGKIFLGTTATIDEVNGRVGIGTTAPGAHLQIYDSGSTKQLSIVQDGTGSADRGLGIEQHNTGVQGALINFYKSRGTAGTPTTVASGDYGGIFVFNNYDGTAYRANANWGYRSSGTIGTNSIPGELFFAVSQASDQDPYTNGTVRMVINSSGNVGIGTTAPTAYLHTKAGTATASTAPIKLTAGTVNTTPEAGAIEFDGSNFFFSI